MINPSSKKGQEGEPFRPHFYNAWVAFTRKRAEGSLQIGLNRHPLQVLTVWLKQPLTGLRFKTDFDSVAWPRNHRQNASKTDRFRQLLVICKAGCMIV